MSWPRETMTSLLGGQRRQHQHGGGGVVVDDSGRFGAGQFRQNIFDQFIALDAFAGVAVHGERAIALQLAHHGVHHARRENGAAQAGVEDDAGGVDGFAQMGFGGLLEKFFRPGQHRFGGDMLESAAAVVVVEDLLPQPGHGAAQAFGDERLRMLPEPAGGGFAFQQFRDRWKRSKQFLFWVRHVFGARLFWPSTVKRGYPDISRLARHGLHDNRIKCAFAKDKIC